MKPHLQIAGFVAAMLAPVFLEAAEFQFTAIDTVPQARLSLGDAALIAPEHFNRFDIEFGEQAVLRSDNGTTVSVHLFPINRPTGTISIRQELRERLGVELGPASITVTLVPADVPAHLAPDLAIAVRANPGDPGRWPGIVLGAPHADYDAHTGQIVELASELAAIPSVTGWRSRVTFLGRWLDMNRPLQREPGEQMELGRERSWTDEAEEVYERYRAALIEVGTAGRTITHHPPVELYVDFHGHSLTVPLPDGGRAPRFVVEVMTRGYSLDEVHRLKDAFDKAVRSEYGDEAPPSYWGNIPEDRRYLVEGVETSLAYPGLGARVTGALGPQVTHRAIHIETPMELRSPVDNRPKTARALVQFITEARDMLPTREVEWVDAPGGEFYLGTAGRTDQETEEFIPNHPVLLSPFRISRTEITNHQFAIFAIQALEAGDAAIADGVIVDAATGEPWLLLAPMAAHSAIMQNGGTVQTLAQLADHPVVNVTWFGATAYARHAGGRLPTEAEWEYAAKWAPTAGKAIAWSEADDRRHEHLPPGNYMHSPQREAGLPIAGTTPVGSFPSHDTPIGCLDMTGNVWEWTADWTGGYQRTSEPVRDPTGFEGGSMKVVRGGSWDTEPVTVQPTYRFSVAPHAALPTVGFRIARAAAADPL